MKTIPYSILFLILASSCSDSKNQQLIGTWEIKELKIKLNSFQNRDTVMVIEATAENWEQKMKTRNIQTTYNLDGSYHSLHRNLNDSITYDPAGTWTIHNDTLTIQDTIPKRVIYTFKIKASTDSIEYWGIEDFDQDGKIDDEYYSKQQRVK
jgi:hypothetical protein